MIERTIKVEMDKKPTTCFNCPFSVKMWCYAHCPFLKACFEDGKRIPSDCPLTLKNKDKTYQFDMDYMVNLLREL